ncbi:MAG: ribose 5-phosphate isomerase A [Ignavibacteria bacterium GWA2_35_9]|nr:MAG: ribose 5-phosphate isomerase A [Ignavibacteria bacterium GWA2_35_9]OGU45896.1 MAG: ribose 5-phosphate isomerase A [Ignavibacteria bacterium GWB2_36_8]
MMSEKQIAAEKAIEFVNNGMILGLGSGSTAAFFIKKLGEQVKRGLKITGVSTSNAATNLALSNNIPLVSIEEVSEIDLTVDGADEVDPEFNGIKGGGGALLYEKIVASISKEIIWVVDSSKLVKRLGKFPLPVEIVTFGHTHTLRRLKDAGYNPSLRVRNGELFPSDGNNFIADLELKVIDNPVELEKKLKILRGVIETGLFVNAPDKVIIGENNTIKILENKGKNK